MPLALCHKHFKKKSGINLFFQNQSLAEGEERLECGEGPNLKIGEVGGFCRDLSID